MCGKAIWNRSGNAKYCKSCVDTVNAIKMKIYERVVVVRRHNPDFKILVKVDITKKGAK